MAISVPPGSPVMTEPGIDVWRKTNRPRPIWVFEMDLAGSDVVLSVAWGGGGFTVSTNDDDDENDNATHGRLSLLSVPDIDSGAAWDFPSDRRDVVRWEFTFRAAEEIPLGKIAVYWLRREVRADDDEADEPGEYRVYREGHFIGKGGAA